MTTYRDASKGAWGPNGEINREDINAGSLQRIADAAEKMAASYDAMRESRDRYKRYFEEEQERVAERDRTIIALRGVITRLKNRGES